MKVEPLHCQYIRYLEEAKFKVEGNIKLAASLLSLHDILLFFSPFLTLAASSGSSILLLRRLQTQTQV